MYAFCNVWVCVCVGVLVICVLVFTVFLYCFVDVYLFLFVTSKGYCHRVKTQLQQIMMMMMMMMMIMMIIIIIIMCFSSHFLHNDATNTVSFPSFCCSTCKMFSPFWTLCRVQLKCDDTRRRTGREVRGNLANVVGSRYPSQYLGTWCIQHYYRWCAHIGCQ